MDDALDDAQQARCAHCDVIMRDVPGGWECAVCGRGEFVTLDGPLPPEFDGPAINGG
ncbi:hypothetical protein QL996_03650 [Planococcus sp. APC 4015]|nr:hypothetical protein [Planococcus sp. APC 4015]